MRLFYYELREWEVWEVINKVCDVGEQEGRKAVLLSAGKAVCLLRQEARIL